MWVIPFNGTTLQLAKPLSNHAIIYFQFHTNQCRSPTPIWFKKEVLEGSGSSAIDPFAFIIIYIYVGGTVMNGIRKNKYQ